MSEGYVCMRSQLMHMGSTCLSSSLMSEKCSGVYWRRMGEAFGEMECSQGVQHAAQTKQHELQDEDGWRAGTSEHGRHGGVWRVWRVWRVWKVQASMVDILNGRCPDG